MVRSGSCEAGRKGLSQAIEKLDQLLKASETLSGILAGKQLGPILERSSRTAFDGNIRLSTCVLEVRETETYRAC